MRWFKWLKAPWLSPNTHAPMTFLSRLGLGGQGEVWLARDRLLSRLVTVKRVDSLLDAKSKDTLKSLQARVDAVHPAIPTVFAVIPDGRKTWLVGEFVQGVPLIDLLDELSPESIYMISRDLISALTCLERLGLVHGDLSPNNIVVDVHGQVRLLDFEACSRVGEPQSAAATLGFAAPERSTQHTSLPAADTWSAGAVITWLITKAAPTIVLDDQRKAVAVEMSQQRAQVDMLSDLLNVAVAATRIDPSLRPGPLDLQHKLKLSYRWLEPLSRASLARLVQHRSPSEPTAETIFDFPHWAVAQSRGRVWRWLLAGALLTVLGLAAYQPAHRYSLDVDTARVSPATVLPSAFNSGWVRTVFKDSLPQSWTHTQAENSDLISMDISCARGVCELLVQHEGAGPDCLHHSSVINTPDDRVWRAALTELARSLSAE